MKTFEKYSLKLETLDLALVDIRIPKHHMVVG